MRSRLSIDGAITAYREGRTDETLEASESRRLKLRREMFDVETRPAAAMRRRFTKAHPHPDQHETVTTIEIEVQGRWDALALSEPADSVPLLPRPT